MPWPVIEPSRGVLRPELGRGLRTGLSRLPGRHESDPRRRRQPAWETGSADDAHAAARTRTTTRHSSRARPALRRRVAAYEIWNEEDEPTWWAGAPDPAAYAQLLKAAYPAVKAAEPEGDGRARRPDGQRLPFLEGVYAAGGKGSFDAVGVHTDTACNVLSPYEYLRGADNRMIADSLPRLPRGPRDDARQRRRQADLDDRAELAHDRARRARKASGRGRSPKASPRTQQATYLRQAYHCLAEDPYVQVALWFPLPRRRRRHLGPDARRRHAQALVRRDARPTSATATRCSESCGVFTGPSDHGRLARQPHRATAGPLPIHVSARSADGRVPHPPRGRRQADPQLRRQNATPSHARRRDHLAGRQAHRLRPPHADVPGLRQGAQRLAARRSRSFHTSDTEAASSASTPTGTPRQRAPRAAASANLPAVRTLPLRLAGLVADRAGRPRRRARLLRRDLPARVARELGHPRRRRSSRTTTRARAAAWCAGMHFQIGAGVAKLVRCARGRDLRRGGRHARGLADLRRSGRRSSSTTRTCASSTSRSASPTASACSATSPTCSTSRPPTTTPQIERGIA